MPCTALNTPSAARWMAREYVVALVLAIESFSPNLAGTFPAWSLKLIAMIWVNRTLRHRADRLRSSGFGRQLSTSIAAATEGGRRWKRGSPSFRAVDCLCIGSVASHHRSQCHDAVLHDRVPVVLEESDWPVRLGEKDGDTSALMRPAVNNVLYLGRVSGGPRPSNRPLPRIVSVRDVIGRQPPDGT